MSAWKRAMNLPGQLDHALIAARRLVRRPKAVEERVELLEITLREPVAPRNAEIVGVGGERSQCAVAPVAPCALPLEAREAREVGGVRATGSALKVGVPAQPLDGVFLDRGQHHETSVAVRAAPADQTLVHQRGEAVERVDPSVAVVVDAPRDCLDRFERCARERREQLEQPLLTRLEQLVTPFDGGAERLLAGGQVTRPASQQLEALVQPVEQRLW